MPGRASGAEDDAEPDDEGFGDAALIEESEEEDTARMATRLGDRFPGSTCRRRPRSRRRKMTPMRGSYHVTVAVPALVVPAAAQTTLAAPARAADGSPFFAGKTVRILVGFSAGGGYDIYARELGRYLGRHIPGNSSIVVQPGA
jgi:hypothetical protein